MVLYPSFGWDEPATTSKATRRAHFAEILVDVVAAEVFEPWAAANGTWIFRSSNPEPED
jgi:hypothetical protein